MSADEGDCNMWAFNRRRLLGTSSRTAFNLTLLSVIFTILLSQVLLVTARPLTSSSSLFNVDNTGNKWNKAETSWGLTGGAHPPVRRDTSSSGGKDSGDPLLDEPPEPLESAESKDPENASVPPEQSAVVDGTSGKEASALNAGSPDAKVEVTEVDEAAAARKEEAGKEEVQSSDADTDDESTAEHKPMPGLKAVSPAALLRGFYVFLGVGTIVLIYIVVKLIRLRRRRATRKYRVLSHNDEQEMFPLAADDGDDEEIYNAADHHTHK